MSERRDEEIKEYQSTAGGKNKIITVVLLVVFFLLCMGASFYVSRYVLVVIPIEGDSMEPTVHDGDKVLVYRTQKLRYDDIIVFYCPEMSKQLIKRVIGVAGDTVEIKYSYDDGCYHVYRNGEMLSEDNINAPMTSYYSEMSIVVPEGKFFFLGDNRNISADSHDTALLGTVTEVKGRVLMRFKNLDIKFLSIIEIKK